MKLGKIKASRVCLFFFLFLLPVMAMAENATVVLELEKAFKAATSVWITPLKEIASHVLWLLGTISLTWTLIMMIIKGFDLPDILFEMTRFIMFFGFFYALILNSHTWPMNIIDGFVEAARLVSTSHNNGVFNPSQISAVSPSQVMERGFVLSNRIIEANSGWIVDHIAFVFVGIIVVVIYAVVTALMMLTVVEMHLVVAAGVLLLGFAGTPWTSDYAKKYLVYTVSVGMKMYMTMLVVGLAESFISDWVNHAERQLDNGASIMAIIAILVMFVYLVIKIPDFVQSLITGAALSGNTSSLTSGMDAVKSGVGAAASVVGAAAGVVGGAAKGGAAVANANRLTAAKGGSGVSGALGTAKNLGGAAMKTAGQRLQGKNHNGEEKGGSTMSQINDNLKKSIEKEKESSSGNISGYKSPAGDK